MCLVSDEILSSYYLVIISKYDGTKKKQYHTTTDSSVPTVVLFTILVIAYARDGVLCRLHFTGNAASVAKLRYMEHVSVGDGCRLVRADKYTYKNKNSHK
jgi:hypothetical protein